MRITINLVSHFINHANSEKNIKPIFPVLGIETTYTIEIIKVVDTFCARILNQNKFKYQTVFSAKFDKKDADRQMWDEIEIYINLNVNQNLTESDLRSFDIISPIENQFQKDETKDSGWRVDKNNSMKKYFYKNTELNSLDYVKIPLRSSAILNIEKDDKFCFFWSFLAKLQPCKIVILTEYQILEKNSMN